MGTSNACGGTPYMALSLAMPNNSEGHWLFHVYIPMQVM